MSESSFEFILSNEIGYQNGNEGHTTTNRLIFIEPSVEKLETAVFTARSFIVKGITSQQIKSTDNNSDRYEQETKSKEILNDKKQLKVMVLLSLNTISPNEYASFREILFNKIICNGCCLIDGKIEMTKSIFDKVCIKDRENIIGEYCANFIVPSWLLGG